MSDLALILDRIAAKVATVEGVNAVYGTTISQMPSDFGMSCVALVEMGSSVARTGNLEREDHSIDVLVYISGGSLAGPAYERARQLPARFRAVFRSGIQLDGAAAFCQYAGYDKWSDEDVNGKPYLVLPIRLTAVEEQPAEYTP